jgi:hypothetical protein
MVSYWQDHDPIYAAVWGVRRANITNPQPQAESRKTVTKAHSRLESGWRVARIGSNVSKPAEKGGGSHPDRHRRGGNSGQLT